ncbi:MAG: hypothetical protein Q8K98_07065 [Bacteroidota bacterium]|nr:hypothetical protein [Bacteroidota bacterium]
MKKQLSQLVSMVLIILLIASVAVAQESFKLEYKFEKGKTFRYKDISSGKMTQEMMGKEMKMSSEGEKVIKIIVDDVSKTGDITITTSTDSMKVFSSTPMGDTTIYPTELLNKRTVVTFSNKGKILLEQVIDSIKQTGRMASMAPTEPVKFHILPEDAKAIGTIWNSLTVDTVDRMGGKVLTTSDIEYTLVGKEKKLGYDCLKISFKGKTEIEGKASVQGMELMIEGSGKINGSFYFDPKLGLVVFEDTEVDSEMTMATTGEQAMIIPITQFVKNTRTLVK